MIGVTVGKTYEGGNELGLTVLVKVAGVWMTIGTALAYVRMAHAAGQDGVFLELTSGWRSYEEQAALYAEHVAGTRTTATAAPGHSNHQSGRALDIATESSKSSTSYKWLAAHAHAFGFVRTVPSETWHWEYRPGEPAASYT
jgi:LAS superfamily LD-carboxypeptidase LdcB